MREWLRIVPWGDPHFSLQVEQGPSAALQPSHSRWLWLPPQSPADVALKEPDLPNIPEQALVKEPEFPYK